jgi:glycopeptide antibiotics resistance protein
VVNLFRSFIILNWSGIKREMSLHFRFTAIPLLKTITTLAAIFYFGLLFYIFFLARRRRGPTLPWRDRYLNVVPLKNKLDFFLYHSNVSVPERQQFYIDLVGNIMLFIPFAFFLCLIFRLNGLRNCVLICMITSISIELIQFLLSIGVADIDDVILNTTGAAIGVLIFKLFTKIDFFKNLTLAYGLRNTNAG